MTAIDTSVLFDVLLDHPRHGQLSSAALQTVLGQGPVVVCAVVYAELAAAFPDPGQVDGFLGDLGIEADSRLEPGALAIAATAWKTYSRTRERRLACPVCGTATEVSCPKCGEVLAPRRHILADFLIAGHAAARGARLLTRDRGFFRRYFPTLELVVPGE
ncbi:MAG TPA: PIN domain-containing protein [Bacillota bacterium]|nr:PIN domain-containing protein [Bacillota bacterium]